MKFVDKLKLIRKANNMTQANFTASIGISRGNLANIELGNVAPTPIFINCVSLMFQIDKNWLIDDNNDDLSVLNGSTNMLSLIMDKYELLDDQHKKFVENQINELLKMQENKTDSNKN